MSPEPETGRCYDVLIVGAGHAGANAAIALRQSGFAGSIALLGDEPDAPYERPPLSKEYLAGDKSFDRLLIRPLSFWAEQNIDLLLGHRALSIDPERDAVHTSGASIGYGRLIWATGGAPRSLACGGHDLAGIHTIRTRADVDRLIGELPAVQRIVVVGAGYIGLEAAAVLTKLGKQVTVLETQDRVLARVAGETLSRFYEAEHRAHGVDLRLNIGVECLQGNAGRVTGVCLKNGSLLPADLVIVGIGVAPAVQLLLAAGAEGGNGVDVDAFCRTSLPRIYAIGDCAAHHSAFAGGCRVRIESVQNAKDQAVTAARSIMGMDAPYRAVPWFWSNQYDLRLQTVGLLTDHDDVVLRGDPTDRSFSLIYLRNSRVVALDCVNRTADYVQGKALVLSGLAVDRSSLADSGKALRYLLEA